MISLDDGQPDFPVYCDHSTNEGGWIVFQNRYAPFKMSFNREWVEYERGFGNLASEHWLGNEILKRLTANTTRRLLIELTNEKGESGFAQFLSFKVSGRINTLSVESYSGSIGDSISHVEPSWNLSYVAFSTPDRDNDNNIGGKCSTNSGWWFNWCSKCDLNAQNPWWSTWANAAITRTMMKLR